MPNEPAYILIYGRDLNLLKLRKLVLQLRGYVVLTTCSEIEARQFLSFTAIDLMLLCYTLPTEECDSLVREATIAWPGTKVLILTASTFDGCHQQQGVDSSTDAMRSG